MKKLLAVMAITMGMLAGTAYADTGLYAGIDYQRGHYILNEGGQKYSWDLDAAQVRIGDMFLKNLGAELRYSMGVSDANLQGTKLKMENAYGVYLKGYIPVSDMVKPYAILGYSDVRSKLSSGVGSLIIDKDGLSYGLGFDYSLADSMAVNLEYVQYIQGKNVNGVANADYGAANLGITYHF